MAGLNEKHSKKLASNKAASNVNCKSNGSLVGRLLELQRFAEENVILPEDVSGKILRILTMGKATFRTLANCSMGSGVLTV